MKIIGKTRLLAVILIVLLVSLVISIGTVQFTTGILTETRKSALVNALSQRQRPDGSFHGLSAWEGATLYTTINALLILQTLGGGASNVVELGNQYVATYTNYTDLYSLERLVFYSTEFNITLDKPSIIQSVLLRYNQSGAFHETNVTCGFHLEFGGKRSIYLAWFNPNIISTYLAIDILSRLDALGEINVTKTLNWILSCKAENGFKPFPDIREINPFKADMDDVGIPYTYCGISALKILGHLDDVSEEDRNKIGNYTVQCQHPDDGFRFWIHRDNTDYLNSFYYSLYAVQTLYDIHRMTTSIEDLVDHMMEDEQYLRFDGWSIAEKESSYGLFYLLPEGPVTGCYEAVYILQLTSMLHLLDSPTPRAIYTIIFLVFVSLLTTAIIITVPWILKRAYDRWRRAKSERHGPTETPMPERRDRRLSVGARGDSVRFTVY